jgi:hypothetical protein
LSLDQNSNLLHGPCLDEVDNVKQLLIPLLHQLPSIVRNEMPGDDSRRQVESKVHPERTSQVIWEKILWRKQPFPDNYVSPTFLSELDALRTFSSSLFSAPSAFLFRTDS